jgi:tetratricopeptide (TPR) repeat protein
MIFYANKALSFNDRLDEAFYIKGNYYDITGDYDRAFKEYSEAIKINPNYSFAYWNRAGLGLLKTFDIYNAFEDGFKSIEIEHGPLRPGMMRGLGLALMNFGFPEYTRYYNKEALKLDNDSISYLNILASLEEYRNDTKALELYEKVLKKDPSSLDALWRSLDCYERSGKYEDAYLTALKILQIWKENDYSPQYGWDYLGYAFWKTGHTKEAKYYFDKQIDLGEKILKLDPNDDQGKLVLARVYAALGEKEKSFKFLNEVNDLIYIRFNKGNIGSVVYLYFLKYDPLLENLRREPIFQKEVSDYENIYNITYERFKAWLANKGMLK